MRRMEKGQGSDARRFAEGVPGGVRLEPAIYDSARVDIKDWNSRQFWSTRLGLSEAQLMQAVRAVGTAVMRIEEYLQERRKRRALRRRATGLA